MSYRKKPFYCVSLDEFCDYARYKIDKAKRERVDLDCCIAAILPADQQIRAARQRAESNMLMLCTPKICNESWKHVMQDVEERARIEWAREFHQDRLDKYQAQADLFARALVVLNSYAKHPNQFFQLRTEHPLLFLRLPTEISIIILHFLFQRKVISKRALGTFMRY